MAMKICVICEICVTKKNISVKNIYQRELKVINDPMNR